MGDRPKPLTSAAMLTPEERQRLEAWNRDAQDMTEVIAAADARHLVSVREGAERYASQIESFIAAGSVPPDQEILKAIEVLWASKRSKTSGDIHNASNALSRLVQPFLNPPEPPPARSARLRKPPK